MQMHTMQNCPLPRPCPPALLLRLCLSSPRRVRSRSRRLPPPLRLGLGCPPRRLRGLLRGKTTWTITSKQGACQELLQRFVLRKGSFVYACHPQNPLTHPPTCCWRSRAWRCASNTTASSPAHLPAPQSNTIIHTLSCLLWDPKMPQPPSAPTHLLLAQQQLALRLKHSSFLTCSPPKHPPNHHTHQHSHTCCWRSSACRCASNTAASSADMGGSAGVVTTLLRCPLAMLRMSWLGRRGTGSVGSTKPPWHGGRGVIPFCYWIVYGVCPPHEAALAWWWRCVCVGGGIFDFVNGYCSV